MEPVAAESKKELHLHDAGKQSKFTLGHSLVASGLLACWRIGAGRRLACYWLAGLLVTACCLAQGFIVANCCCLEAPG